MVVATKPVEVHLWPYDHAFVNWMMEEGRVVGCRVRQVGGLFIEIHKMAFNLRVVVTDPMCWVGGPWFAFCGYGWCFPRELGYPKVSSLVWEWADFDPADPGRTNPPGPWIKAIHSQVYREPGIGQRGPV